MPNDNALLPPTIHLGYLPDKVIIGHLARAYQSIRFIGPGLSEAAARMLVARWQDLGWPAVQQCPTCKRKIAWERPAVHKCRCGLDFRQVSSEAADPGPVAINTIVFRAAKFTLAETARVEVG
jgi:hypothetical protein